MQVSGRVTFGGTQYLCLKASPRVWMGVGSYPLQPQTEGKQTGSHASTPPALAAFGYWIEKNNISSGAARNPFLSRLAMKSSTLMQALGYLLLIPVDFFYEKRTSFPLRTVSAWHSTLGGQGIFWPPAWPRLSSSATPQTDGPSQGHRRWKWKTSFKKNRPLM